MNYNVVDQDQKAEKDICDQANPCDNSGWWSYMFFVWPGSLVKLGASQILTMKDLPSVSVHDDSSKIGARLRANWDEQVRKYGKDASLVWALIWTVWKMHWFGGLLLLTESGARIYQALVLGRLIAYFLGQSDNTQLIDNGYFMSFQLVACGLYVMMIHHHAFYLNWRLGLQMRIACTSVIYDKAITLSLRSLGQITVGHIVNLSAQDVEGFQQLGCFFHFLYQPVIEAAIILYFGVREVGPSFVAGFAVIIVLIPLQSLFSRWTSEARRKTSKLTDERVKLINQALQGSRLMKINGWEDVFVQLIEGVRKKEIKAIMRAQLMRGINEAIFFGAPVLIAFITFSVYAKATGGVLTMGKVFIVMSFFSIIQFSFMKFFVMGVMCTSEGLVALNRIRNLLLLEEALPNMSTSADASGDDGIEMTTKRSAEKEVSDNVKIEFRSYTATWRGEEQHALATAIVATDAAGKQAESAIDEHEQEQITSRDRSASNISTSSSTHETSSKSVASANVLEDINLTVRKGELIVVVGPVGCAKTSLLMAVLGELNIIRGEVVVKRDKLKVLTTESASIPPLSGVTTWMQYADEDALEVARAALAEEQRGEGISYCAQEPWIMSNSLKNNILFGKPFDEKKYQTVITSCALDTDLKELPNGDLTIIGDKGVNLSGGQRARVGLARALYADTSILLLDDPLSAVDAHVGSHLFNEAICRHSSAATRILVTHQTQFLSSDKVSKIVVMKGGRIVSCGTYQALLDSGVLSMVGSSNINATEEARPASLATSSSINAPSAVKTIDVENSEDVLRDSQLAPAPASIIVKEDASTGDVKLSTYKAYALNLGGYVVCATILLLMIAGQVSVIFTNLWLAYWSKLDEVEQKDLYYYKVYIALVATSIFFSGARAVVAFQASLVASERMHNEMLKCIVRAPILFFDSNPVGRILNRFTKDITFADEYLPFSLYDFLQCILMVLGAVIVVCLGSPIIFIALIPLVIYFHFLRLYFLKASREIKRLEAVSRSPVFSQLSESLDGLVTVRAMNCTKQFQALYKQLLNENCRAFFSFMAASRWLGFRLDATTVALLACVTFGAVGCKEGNLKIDPSLLAVGITYVLQLMGLFQWAVRQSVEVDSQMVSIERIDAYSRLASEPALHGPANVGKESLVTKTSTETPGTSAATNTVSEDSVQGLIKPELDIDITVHRPNWPEHGSIEAQHLWASYREDLPYTLKNLSFSIKPGARVGIVGRTGAGKSTLVSALLRLVDTIRGEILIDGIPIHKVGLHDLRPRLSVIPQVPFLFSGTVRKNLDPFDICTDAQIWSALDATGLRGVVSRLSSKASITPESRIDSKTDCVCGDDKHSTAPKLDGIVDEGGLNFSTGERQLLCLARAILQKNRILIMDEATANIDLETDKKVQRAIREQFSDQGTTVIMIAHRLHTVIDCDQILVLAHGELQENDAPHELLWKYFGDVKVGSGPDGSDLLANDVAAIHPPRHSFASLVKQTGPEMCLKLRKIAASAAKKK